MLTTALVVLVALPALGAGLAGLLRGRAARIAAVAVAAATASVAIWSVAVVHGRTYRDAVGTLPWLEGFVDAPVLGVLLDPLSSILLLLACPLGFLAVLFSTDYLREGHREHPVGEQDQGRYYFWLLLFLASMSGVALAANFLQLFVFWELTTVCSWALISFNRSEASLRAGYKAMLMTHAGGLAFLVAVLVLFVETGSFEFRALGQLAEPGRGPVFLLLMVAAWAKAAQFPLSSWLPDAMEAPTPVSAYLHAAAMVKAGVYLMARATSAGWAMPEGMAVLLGTMALVTIFVALSCYFVQDDLKRLLAWSTIAHLGYVLLAVALGALGSVVAYRGGALHILCHGIAKGTLFFCVGAVAYATGTRRISALAGLGKAMPLTATAFFVGVVAVTGIPPFACFWSKLLILAGAVKLGGVVAWVVVPLVLIESLIAFGWMVHVGQRVFLGEPTPAASGTSDPPPAMSATLLVLLLACLGIAAVGLPLVQGMGG